MEIRDDIEYGIGAVEIDASRLKHEGFQPYDAAHKFIVQAHEGTALLYVCRALSHKGVAHHFGIRDTVLVGGGSCYIDGQNRLVLDDYSGSYGCVPEQAAQAFVQILAKHLSEKGISFEGVVARPKFSLSNLNKFWFS